MRLWTKASKTPLFVPRWGRQKRGLGARVRRPVVCGWMNEVGAQCCWGLHGWNWLSKAHLCVAKAMHTIVRERASGQGGCIARFPCTRLLLNLKNRMNLDSYTLQSRTGALAKRRPFAISIAPFRGDAGRRTLPVGGASFQLYSLGDPNGVKVTVMLERMLAGRAQGRGVMTPG